MHVYKTIHPQAGERPGTTRSQRPWRLNSTISLPSGQTSIATLHNDQLYAYSPQVKPQTTSGRCPLQALGQFMCKIYINPTMLVAWAFAEQDLDGCQILGLHSTQVHTELQPILQLK